MNEIYDLVNGKRTSFVERTSRKDGELYNDPDGK